MYASAERRSPGRTTLRHVWAVSDIVRSMSRAVPGLLITMLEEHRRTPRPVVVCALVLTAASCARQSTPSADRRSTLTVSVVGTSDLHGGVLAEDGRGGLALLDGYVRNLRAARQSDGGGVLLVDAGDMFQGTLESNLNEGQVVVAAYNALGYAAAAVGNHEFDYGPIGDRATPAGPQDDPRGALKSRAAEARFPFLAANIIDESTEMPVRWPNVQPSTIVDVAGVRVGIVGVTTSATLSATMAANTVGLAIAPLAPTLAAEATRLRASGATVVIASAHAGGRCTAFENPSDLSSCGGDEEIFRVARALPGGVVDAIVAGHRHFGIAHEVAGIPIVSSYSGGRAFGRFDLIVDRQTGRVTSHRIFPPRDLCATQDPATRACARLSSGTALPSDYEGRPVAASADIDRILAPAVERARSVKGRRLNGRIADPLRRTNEESALGNLVADWARAAAGADVAIANSGGIRADLPAGPLTFGRLYAVTPFDNREMTLTLTGEELRRVIANNLQHRGSLILISGVRATAACGSGELRVTLRRDPGRTVTDTDRLRVATSDFLAAGGDGILTPVSPLRDVKDEGRVVRDGIADWIQRHGRTWRAAELLTAENRRLTFPGTRPVRCDRP
jgi:2',3'-cyclic-nucleotide 2'-phosphodiesterase (5'-nucleotidase family)